MLSCPDMCGLKYDKFYVADKRFQVLWEYIELDGKYDGVCQFFGKGKKNIVKYLEKCLNLWAKDVKNKVLNSTEKELISLFQYQIKNNSYDVKFIDTFSVINTTIKKMRKKEKSIIDIQHALNIIEHFENIFNIKIFDINDF